VNIPRTIGRIAAVLATVGALSALAGVAHAETSRPPGMSQGEYRALTLRSEALNEEHGLGTQSAVPRGMTAAEYRALMLRSEALNEEYGLGAQRAADAASRPADPAPGFAWGAFGIGAAAMLGLALLAGGLVVRLATRRGPIPSGTT
jgi:hypothetical protein